MVKADGEKKSCEKNENNDMMNDHTTFSRSEITGVTYSNGILGYNKNIETNSGSFSRATCKSSWQFLVNS